MISVGDDDPALPGAEKYRFAIDERSRITRATSDFRYVSWTDWDMNTVRVLQQKFLTTYNVRHDNGVWKEGGQEEWRDVPTVFDQQEFVNRNRK